MSRDHTRFRRDEVGFHSNDVVLTEHRKENLEGVTVDTALQGGVKLLETQRSVVSAHENWIVQLHRTKEKEYTLNNTKRNVYAIERVHT